MKISKDISQCGRKSGYEVLHSFYDESTTLYQKIIIPTSIKAFMDTIQ